jgi:hypothetical protein
MHRGSNKHLNLDLFEMLNDSSLWGKCTDLFSDDAIDWTDEDIAHICDCLLEDSLRNLFDSRLRYSPLSRPNNHVIKIEAG